MKAKGKKMGRPKGSKNKKTVAVEEKETIAKAVSTQKVEEPEVALAEDVKEGTPPVANTKKVTAATTFNNMWVPKPDMGEVKPLPDAESICECEHKRIVHYGSQHNWCNAQNCRCAAWTPR